MIRLLGTAWLVTCGALSAQHGVSFSPAGPLRIGDPIVVTAVSEPGTEVGLTVQMIDRHGRTWRSEQRYRVGADGRLDLRRDAPLSGSDYRGADPLGPFWSLSRCPEIERVSPPAGGHARRFDATLTRDGVDLASCEATCFLRTPEVMSLEVESPGIVATYYHPRAATRLGAVLVLGDANGGRRAQHGLAQLLASHGYAALALGSFGERGLPAALQELPLEHVTRAVDWLVARAEIDGRRLAVIGGSKGAELALLAASRDPRLSAVVAMAPSSVVWQGIPSKPAGSSWRSGGESVAYVPYAKSETFARTRRLADLYRESLDRCPPQRLARAAIPVEAIGGPVLLLAGGEDRVWPAARMAREIAERLKRHDHPYEVRLLEFPDAGHEVGGPGYGPASVSSSMGGSRRAKARALADGWSTTLEFLQRALRPAVPADLGARLDAYVEPLLRDRLLSGVLIVRRGDDILIERRWGMADYEHGVPNTTDTKFCIASISKPITRCILRQLVDEGRVSMADSIARWLPDFPRGDQITVAMLRDHRSGLPHRVTTPAQQVLPTTAAEMTTLAAKATLRFVPGAQELYSSAGYSVLARVLELADGRPYHVMLDERICRPVGLQATSHTNGRSLLRARARPYVVGLRGPENAPPMDLSFLVGAGSIWSTAADIDRLCEALTAGQLVPGTKPSAFVPDEDEVWSGRTYGYASFVQWLPGLDMRVVFVGNLPAGREPLRAGLLALIRGEEPPALTRLSRGVDVPWRLLIKCEGTYRVAEDFYVTVALHDGALRCAGSVLIPASATTFYYPARKATLDFEFDSDGRATGVRWREGGGVSLLKRVKPGPRR